MSDLDTAIPPGWSYNPATWTQRLPIVGLAILGLAAATYLGLFQLKLIPTVWEPFFGNGSQKILTSGVSKILPIPDALLGAFGYLVDAVAGLIGGIRRWRTMPWIVILFGIMIGPLGMISILLVVLQPVLYDAWCTLCLFSAVISVLMIGPAMDEMLASLQYMKRVKDANGSLWKAFWGYKEVYEKAI
ncbi:vitamin K epoxide reductase family protein [Pontibacter sp. KCTC 32443]|uniref:vitamin K epoxide reductase family protein n=1 Tax=Pontibacter TaxID=323449 RepID=UPI00164EB19F|nr:MULTISPECIES: vitamin K epoxide reductase family protein [Pontibacter]MBC5775335.1 vitamin K epoxide reductase family protein [Pontibacter sp. KCTC 32443]